MYFFSFSRYLFTGILFIYLSQTFRLGHSTVHKIVIQVCEAIWDEMVGEQMPKMTATSWKQMAQGFESRWNFPHCVGAIDGKHVHLVAPPNGGSLFYNFKQYHSVVMMALCSYDYRYIMVDVGSYGSNNDPVFLCAFFYRMHCLQRYLNHYWSHMIQHQP